MINNDTVIIHCPPVQSNCHNGQCWHKDTATEEENTFFFQNWSKLDDDGGGCGWKRRKRTNIMMVWIIIFIFEDNASDENLTEVKRGRILQSFSWFASHGQYVHWPIRIITNKKLTNKKTKTKISRYVRNMLRLTLKLQQNVHLLDQLISL